MDPRIVLLFAAALAAGTVGAQQVHRCGNTFSQVPCGDGTKVSVAAPAADAQAAARAREAAKIDAERAAVYERARLKMEKEAPKAVVPPGPQVVAAAPVKKESAPKKGAKDPATFTATVPGTGKPKK